MFRKGGDGKPNGVLEENAFFEVLTKLIAGLGEPGLRVGGAKLTIDGSPQGFTAFRDRPYCDPVGEYASFYKGYAAVTNEQVMDAVDWAFKNNIQILTHANGEAASDLLFAAIKDATVRYGGDDHRPILLFCQKTRPRLTRKPSIH